MKGLLADLRHAVRIYGRTPVASSIAVVVLAVGMAFVGAFLSLYVDLVLKPHPGIEDSGAIVTIGQVDGTRYSGLPMALLERMNAEVSALDAAAGAMASSVQLAPDNENVIVEAVSAAFFERIRPRLSLGRGFGPADHEPDAEPVVVVSDSFWREALDADPDVLGTTIEIVQQPRQRVVMVNGRAQVEMQEPEEPTREFRIVGVMAPEMRGLMIDQIAFWAPMEIMLPMTIGGGTGFEQLRIQLPVFGLGRLKDGASAEGLRRELESRYPESTDEYRLNTGFRLDAMNGVVRNINVHRDAQRQLRLFLSGSVLLALVAAANVSLFLLARAPGRRRELAIRMSVGAPLKRLARQLASEAALLVAAAALLGLIGSVWLANFLRGLAFLQRAEWTEVSLLDWRVLGLVGAFLLMLSLLVSLAPILGLKRLGIAGSSRQVAARASLAQRVAGTAQIAIAGTLGGAAIAFAWFLGSMTLGFPGYETANRHYSAFNPFFISQSGGPTVGVFETSAIDAVRLRETIEAIPGVSAFSFGTLVPGAQSVLSTTTVPDPADPAAEISIGRGSIDSRYVEVLGLRLLYGRTPAEGETGVALVNQALARLYFGREDVVGERLDITTAAGPQTEIVGVLQDLSFLHPAADVGPILFAAEPPSAFGMRGVIASALPAGELERQLQALIDAGELELGQPRIRSLEDIRAELIAPDKARSLLTVGTALLVVLLAAFGFYGTQRYLVTAGRREYAIRASLGAGPRALGRLVFGRGLALALPGLVLGSLLAFILVAWLQEDFVSREIPAGTITLIVLAGLTLLLSAATLGPARQARRTQPAPLLREE